MLGVAYSCWQFSLRWRIIRPLIASSPQLQHRMAIVPVELDLTQTQITDGTFCNLGYAGFSVSQKNALSFFSYQNLVVGGSNSFVNLTFLEPWNPSSSGDELSELKKYVSKLPAQYAFRTRLDDSKATGLDFQIQLEHITPPARWRDLFFLETPVFKFTTISLMLKRAIPYGHYGTYTFKTDQVRGLILVGDTADDASYAIVNIEDLSRTQAVVLWAKETRNGDILPVLKPMLKTFAFKRKAFPSPEELRSDVEQLGLPLRSLFDDTEETLNAESEVK